MSNAFAVPCISPSGTTIAFEDAGNIWTIPAGGGTPTEIYNGGVAFSGPLVWSPTSTKIAFTLQIGTVYNVGTMNATGGTVTNVAPGGLINDNVFVNSWSPDGLSLACTAYSSVTSPGSTIIISATNNGAGIILTPAGFDDTVPCFSPDSSQVAFYRSNIGGATPGIYVSNTFGTNPQLLVPNPSSTGLTGGVSSMAWSPFQEGQTFVGAHGTITASPVSGFLASQNGSVFASLLTFTATTPSTATLVPSASNITGAPMAYTLGGDSITNISYTNVYNGSHQSLSLTGTPTAIITVDAATGFVDYVVPALAGRAHPTATKSTGNALTCTGTFSAIYDRTGKNLGPGGATTVQFDRSTGKLISFR